MNRKTISWLPLLLALAPSLALAAGGASALVDPDHVQAIAAAKDRTSPDLWESFAAPQFGAAPIATLSPAILEAYDPRMRAEPGRAIVSNDIQVFDLGPTGVIEVLPSDWALDDGSMGPFDATFDASGAPLALVSFRSSLGGGGMALMQAGPVQWSTVASAPVSCLGTLSLVLDSAGAPAGFCDDAPILVSGSALTVGAPLDGGASAAAATRDAAGNPVLFAARPIAGGWQVDRFAESGGVWSSQTMGALPLAGGPPELTAASDQAAIVAGYPSGGGDRIVDALEPNGSGGWNTELVSSSAGIGPVSASGSSVIVGEADLVMYRRGANGLWTSQDLGVIGDLPPVQPECSCRMIPADAGAPVGGSSIVLLLPLAALVRARRRRS